MRGVGPLSTLASSLNGSTLESRVGGPSLLGKRKACEKEKKKNNKQMEKNNKRKARTTYRFRSLSFMASGACCAARRPRLRRVELRPSMDKSQPYSSISCTYVEGRWGGRVAK